MMYSYDEGSALAYQIANIMLIVGISPLVFIVAWRYLIQYFNWFFEDDHDILEDIHNELIEIHETLEADQQVDLEVTG